MLKLYHFDRSPYSWKVRMVLAEKNIAYEGIVPENKSESPEFAKLNPLRLTPVLVLDDGRTLYESTMVNEYLEETHPSPAMLPKDPYERARVRIVEDTGDQYLNSAMGNMRNARYEYAPPYLIPKKADQVNEKLFEEGRARVHEILAILENELGSKRWFGGELFSLADAGLVPALTASLPLLKVLPDKRYPNLDGWTRRVKERPSYATSAPKQPLTIKES